MKRWQLILALLVLAGSSGCIAPNHIKYRKQVIRITNEISDIISQIDSPESAKQWSAEIESRKKKIQEIDGKARKEFSTPLKWDEYDEVIIQVKDLIDNELEFTKMRLEAELKRFSDPNASPNIKAAWNQLKNKLENWKMDAFYFKEPAKPTKQRGTYGA